MSVKVMTAVWWCIPYEGADLLMMLALADQANDYGYTTIGYDTVAEKARISAKSVQRAVNKAVTDGYLSVVKGDGRGECSVFHLHTDKFPDEIQFGKKKGDSMSAFREALEKRKRRTFENQKVDICDTAYKEDPLKNPSVLTTPAQPPASLVSGASLFEEINLEGTDTREAGAAEGDATPNPPPPVVPVAATANGHFPPEVWSRYSAMFRRGEMPNEPKRSDGSNDPWTPWQQFCDIWADFKEINSVNPGSKKMAWKAYLKLKPASSEAKKIMAAFDRLMAPGGMWDEYVNRGEQRFIGHLSTFLNGESWKNDD